MAEFAVNREDRNEHLAHLRWVHETFLVIRSALGGEPKQRGASRIYGRASERASFTYRISDKGDVEFVVTILDTSRRRNVAPVRWRSTLAADAAERVLRVFDDLTGQPYDLNDMGKCR